MKKLLYVTIAAISFLGFAQAEEKENEKDIAVKDLPKAVVDAIKAKYPKAEIEEAEEITTKDGKIYEVEIEIEEAGKEQELEIKITADGKIIKVEKEDEDEDDDEEEDDDK